MGEDRGGWSATAVMVMEFVIACTGSGLIGVSFASTYFVAGALLPGAGSKS